MWGLLAPPHPLALAAALRSTSWSGSSVRSKGRWLDVGAPRPHSLRQGAQALHRSMELVCRASFGYSECAKIAKNLSLFPAAAISRASGAPHHYPGRRQATHTPAHSAHTEQRRQAFISRASGAPHHYPGRRQATHTPVKPVGGDIAPLSGSFAEAGLRAWTFVLNRSPVRRKNSREQARSPPQL